MNQKKVPLILIFAVIIFILILVVVLSSYSSKEIVPLKEERKILELKRSKPSKKVTFNDVNVTLLALNKESDCLCFEFDDVSKNISYIFGSEFDNSSVSVYKIFDSSSSNPESKILFTNVYSGNQGFVLSSNPLNVNASYFQIASKVNLENMKYNFINLEPGYTYKVCVNNCSQQNFKAYRFTINYKIQEKAFTLKPKNSRNNASLSFGLSEYDLEYKIKNEYPDIDERVHLEKIGIKKWRFKKNGKYVIAYLKNKYNFILENKNNGEEWSSKKTDSPYELEYQIVEDPDILITNLDENLDHKTFNDDILEFIKTPFTMYNHFLNGPKKKKVDVINKISNKILVFSL